MGRSEDSVGTTWSGAPTGGQARLQQEWVLIAGEITATASVSSIEAGRAVDTAYRRLVDRAAKEGHVLRKPVMCRVVVEAWTEQA